MRSPFFIQNSFKNKSKNESFYILKHLKIKYLYDFNTNKNKFKNESFNMIQKAYFYDLIYKFHKFKNKIFLEVIHKNFKKTFYEPFKKIKYIFLYLCHFINSLIISNNFPKNLHNNIIFIF